MTIENTHGGKELHGTHSSTNAADYDIFEVVTQDDDSYWAVDVTVIGQDEVGAVTSRRSIIRSTRTSGSAPVLVVEAVVTGILDVATADITYGSNGAAGFHVRVNGPSAANMNWTSVVHSIIKVDKPAP